MKLTKVKTSELQGVALDWAVAKCEGYKPWWCESSGEFALEDCKFTFLSEFFPSTDWAQGGAIIASMQEYCQEKNGDDCYCSTLSVAEDWHNHPVKGTGPTPLIAAMRCYVASKLGDFVEIPEELL
jgi:hypothetical protein